MNDLPADMAKRRTPFAVAAAAALVVIAVTVGSGAVFAQDDGAPLRLIPDRDAPAATDRPPRPGQPTGEDPIGRDPDQTPEGFVIDPLQAVEADAIGLLGPLDGGLGRDLWAGSQRSRLARLIRELPAAARSPAQRGLTRRLLLTGSPTEGDGPSGAVLQARLATLLAHGAFEDFDALFALVPLSAMSDELMVIHSDSLLARGDLTRACTTARDQLRVSDLAYWQAVFLLCQIEAGDLAAARLSRTLLAERETAPDAGFSDIIAVLLDEADVLPEAFQPTPLNVAAYLSSGQPLPQAIFEEAGAGLLRGLLRRPETPPETRLALAERLAAILPVDILAGHYRAVDIDDIALADPVPAADELGGAAGRALLLEALRRPQTGHERAQILDALWQAALGEPGYANVAGLAEDAIRSLPATPSMAPYTPGLIRALVLVGARDRAQGWLNILLREAPLVPELTAALASLRPVATMAGLRMSRDWSPVMAQDWFESLDETGLVEDRYAAAEPVFIALDGLGYGVGPDGWWLLLDGPRAELKSIPSIALRYGLRDAVRAGKRGEALLYVLIMLGDDGPAGASALALGAAIRGLRALELEAEARALALEAIVDSGL